jgi:hypothetical protein
VFCTVIPFYPSLNIHEFSASFCDIYNGINYGASNNIMQPETFVELGVHCWSMEGKIFPAA